MNLSMKTQVILFHGTDGNPDNFWFPYIKNNLDPAKYRVLAPQLPDPDKPDINTDRKSNSCLWFLSSFFPKLNHVQTHL